MYVKVHPVGSYWALWTTYPLPNKVIVITSGDNEYIYLVNFLRFHEIFEITPLLKYKKGFFYATAQ